METYCTSCEEEVEFDEDINFCKYCGNKLEECERCDSTIENNKLKQSPVEFGGYRWYLCRNCEEELRKEFMRGAEFK